jgi:hypothetical protein
MKKLENKKIELKFEEDKEMGFADLAKVCVNQIPEGGVPPVEMGKRIAIIAKLDNAKIGDKIELEDAQFDMLKSLADNTGWRLIHKDIVAFNEHLEKLKK